MYYIIFRAKNSRSSLFTSVSSDHRVVSATVKLSPRATKKAKLHPIKATDWKAVSSDRNLSKQFTSEVYNKFQALASDVVIVLESLRRNPGADLA